MRSPPKSPTDEQLRAEIDRIVLQSDRPLGDFIEGSGSAAKRSLMKRWSEDDPLSTLDLQRVLQVVEEINRGGRR